MILSPLAKGGYDWIPKYQVQGRRSQARNDV